MTTLTHSSYQEARIQNNLPVIEIYQLESNGRFFSANVDMDKIYVHEFESHATKCNPADHCMSIDAFFKAGHEFVAGDAITNLQGVVLIVGKNTTVEESNSRCDLIDRECFVLSAKALDESKEPEQVEWNGEGLPPVGCKIRTKDGISEVLSTSNFEGGVVTYWYTHKEGGANIGCAWNNKSWITQIETPEQKKESERLEAAHELYNKSTGSDVSFDYFENKMADKLVKSWIKAVEITGYRK